MFRAVTSVETGDDVPRGEGDDVSRGEGDEMKCWSVGLPGLQLVEKEQVKAKAPAQRTVALRGYQI